MAAQKNSELMDRIAKAEADLQNVIQSRSDVPHEDQHAKERWRHELEARTSDLDHTGGFATTTELWNKGDANPASTPSKSDVEMFAEAVMGQLPAGDQYADSLEGCLAGTPYGEFARWHLCSDSY